MTKITRFRDEVRELLTERDPKLTLKMIATETGLKFGWLQSFARAECENPGVVSVETLAVYLLNRKSKGSHV